MKAEDWQSRTIQFKVADIARSLDVGYKMLKAERPDVMYLSIQLSEVSSWISREAVLLLEMHT